MGLVKCKDCGQGISDRVADCPHCGGPQKAAGGSSALRGCFSVVAGGFLFVVFVAFLAGQDKGGSTPELAKPGPASQARQRVDVPAPMAPVAPPPVDARPRAPLPQLYPPPVAAAPKPVRSELFPGSPGQTQWIVVTARDLARAWADNEIAAEQRYLGKYIAVTGAVESISSAGFSDAFITLDAGELLNSVHCSFSEATIGSLASLRRGSQVRVCGFLESRSLGSWMVKNCKLQ